MFAALLCLLTVPPPAPELPPEPEVPARVKEIDDLIMDENTEVVLDGKPASLQDITDKHEIIAINYDPKTRLILKVQFRTRR